MSDNVDSVILAAARRELDVLRARQDGLDERVVRLPGNAQPELARIVARYASRSLRTMRVCQLGDTDDAAYVDGVWELVAARGVDVLATRLLPYSSNQRTETAGNEVRTRSLAVSMLPNDLTLSAYQTWLVDHCLVLTETMGPGERSGDWVVSAKPEDLAAASRLFDALDALETADDSFTLEEPLVLSADLISGVAGVLCSGDHVSAEGCSWYHGAWQYLRLMDLVSTPTWHSTFYTSQAASALSAGGNALITGTADYSVLAYVLAAAMPAEAHTTVLDLCPTPLFACNWYARRLKTQVNCIQADVFSRPPTLIGWADLVITDAFLTRFPAATSREVLDLWADYANLGGRLVTTVRVHSANPVGRTQAEAVEDFVERALSRYKRWAPYLDPSLTDIASMARAYGRSMVSNEIGDEGAIRQLFDDNPRWSVLSWQRVPVPGELFPTSYVRVVCERTEE